MRQTHTRHTIYTCIAAPIILAVLFFSITKTINAASATTSATASASATPVSAAIAESLKERVQKVLQTQEVTDVQAADLPRLAYVGSLEKLVGSSMQAKTLAGDLHVCEIGKSTRITRSNKAVTKEELELHSAVVFTVQKTQEESCEALTIQSLSALPKVSEARHSIGTYSASTTSALSLSLLGDVNRGAQVTYALTAKTQFFNAQGRKIERKELKNGQKIVVSLVESTNTATSSAKIVYGL